MTSARGHTGERGNVSGGIRWPVPFARQAVTPRGHFSTWHVLDKGRFWSRLGHESFDLNKPDDLT